MMRMTSRDVVRHPLVQKIVDAYENYEKREQYRKERAGRYGHGRDRDRRSGKE